MGRVDQAKDDVPIKLKKYIYHADYVCSRGINQEGEYLFYSSP